MDAISTRRQVISQFILGTAAAWVGGAWHTERLLATETPTVQGWATLVVRLSLFPVLSAVGGSVRLNVGLDYPVAINRGAGGAFYAVNTRCAHLGCTVNAYDSGISAMHCGCHGSRYHIDGSLAGGPATSGLDSYPAVFDGVEKVTVRLQGVTFGAREITLLSTTQNSKRLRLLFQPAIFSSYQVHYRENLTDVARPIAFSTTPDGVATMTTYRNTVFNPDDPSPLVPLYVDAVGSRGFFSIVILISEY